MSLLEYDAYVFWPNGEREHFVLNPSRLDPKALDNARNMLTILSISNNFVRASIVTGRTQSLTRLPHGSGATSVAQTRALRIAGDDGAPLAIVTTFAASGDGMELDAAAKLIADVGKIGLHEVESDLWQATKGRVIAITTFGAKTDLAIDEAYGIALHLGVAMNDGASQIEAGRTAAD